MHYLFLLCMSMKNEANCASECELQDKGDSRSPFRSSVQCRSHQFNSFCYFQPEKLPLIVCRIVLMHSFRKNIFWTTIGNFGHSGTSIPIVLLLFWGRREREKVCIESLECCCCTVCWAGFLIKVKFKTKTPTTSKVIPGA